MHLIEIYSRNFYLNIKEKITYLILKKGSIFKIFYKLYKFLSENERSNTDQSSISYRARECFN